MCLYPWLYSNINYLNFQYVKQKTLRWQRKQKDRIQSRWTVSGSGGRAYPCRRRPLDQPSLKYPMPLTLIHPTANIPCGCAADIGHGGSEQLSTVSRAHHLATLRFHARVHQFSIKGDTLITQRVTLI